MAYKKMELNRIYKLVPQKFKRKWRGIVCMAIMNRIFNLAGLATLLPVIIILIEPASVHNNSFFIGLLNITGSDTASKLGIILCIAAILFLIIKSLFSLIFSIVQNRYLFCIYKYYSQRMFYDIHNKGLLHIRKLHTSQLAFNINNACYGFSINILGTFMGIISETAILILLIVVIIVIAPSSSLLLFLVIIPVELIYILIIRPRLKELGIKGYEAKREQARTVQESLKGYVSLNINDMFKSAEEKFQQGLSTISSTAIKTSLYKQLPAVILQICTAFTLLIIFLNGLAGNSSASVIVLFGFAAIRLFPSIMSIINGTAIIKNNNYVIELIEDLADNVIHANKGHKEAIVFNNSIVIENLDFSIGDNVPILHDFSLTIKKGERIGFSGYSGVGKSTLFNLLLGFFTPLHGDITIDGIKLTAADRKSWHKIIGYVEQESYIFNETLLANIAMDGKEQDERRVTDILHKVGLDLWLNQLPNGLKTILGEGGSTLSGGQKERIGIARALYRNPQVLFLDEPTASLDSASEHEIIRLIKDVISNKNLTVLIISHNERLLELCDKIININ